MFIQKRLKSITTKGQWYNRQSTDKYVNLKSKYNYRARSAFKLLEIQQKYNIIKPTFRVLDLGCTPGGWTQVVLEKLKDGKCVGVDLLDLDYLDKCEFIKGDIRDPSVISRITQLVGEFDVVLSDMAPGFSGQKSIDVPRVHGLCEFVLQVCKDGMLRRGGTMVCKYLHGEGEDELKKKLMIEFESVVSLKPKACRFESAESYFICRGFKDSL